MRLPKVSVLLITYNHRDFIEQSLDSILAQDYPGIEIVVGDDCSTDGTQEILKSYQDKFPEQFKLVLSDINTGITANCNRAFRHCTGELLAFTAGDDIWLPGKLEIQVEAFQRNPQLALCYTRVAMFEDGTDQVISVQPDLKKVSKALGRGDKLDATFQLGTAATSVLVRADFIPPYGFSNDLPNVSDWYFWLEVAMQGDVEGIDQVLARYRRHKGGKSNQTNLVDSEHLVMFSLVDEKYPQLGPFTQQKRMETTDRLVLRNYFETGASEASHDGGYRVPGIKSIARMWVILRLLVKQLWKTIF